MSKNWFRRWWDGDLDKRACVEHFPVPCPPAPKSGKCWQALINDCHIEQQRLAREVRELTEAFSKTVEGAAALAVEVEDAWAATGVASTVRGMVPLKEVIETCRRERDEARAKIQTAEGALILAGWEPDHGPIGPGYRQRTQPPDATAPRLDGQPATETEPRCVRCGAAYTPAGNCSQRDQGCQGGIGEWQPASTNSKQSGLTDAGDAQALRDICAKLTDDLAQARERLRIRDADCKSFAEQRNGVTKQRNELRGTVGRLEEDVKYLTRRVREEEDRRIEAERAAAPLGMGVNCVTGEREIEFLRRRLGEEERLRMEAQTSANVHYRSLVAECNQALGSEDGPIADRIKDLRDYASALTADRDRIVEFLDRARKRWQELTSNHLEDCTCIYCQGHADVVKELRWLAPARSEAKGT